MNLVYSRAVQERIKYQRNTDISQIGLNENDIDNRGIVAVGYASWELFPPYADDKHATRAQAIFNHIGKFSLITTCDSPKAIHEVDWITLFPGTKVVKVVGGFADFCVPTAIEALTRMGLYALVDSKQTFAIKSFYADYTLGKMVMRGVLEYDGRRCVIIGREKFIFYRADMFNDSK